MGLRVLATCTMFFADPPPGLTDAAADKYDTSGRAAHNAQRDDEMLVFACDEQRQPADSRQSHQEPLIAVSKQRRVDVAGALPAAHDVSRIAPRLVPP